MLKIERLNKAHDSKGFDCGDVNLNGFLQRHARQHAERNISRTFILIDNKKNLQTIIGYYTLTICEVVPGKITDPRLQNYPNPLPAAKLARIAVSTNSQRSGFGELLLMNAMERSVSISENAGLVGMFVDAKNDNAAKYYSKYGFVPIKNNPLTLYLSISTIRQTLD